MKAALVDLIHPDSNSSQGANACSWLSETTVLTLIKYMTNYYEGILYTNKILWVDKYYCLDIKSAHVHNLRYNFSLYL